MAEQDIFFGRRWTVKNNLVDAIKAHASHKGKITKLEFRKISFLQWYCLLEFEHEEGSNHG